MNKSKKSKKKNIIVRIYSTDNTGVFYLYKKSKKLLNKAKSNPLSVKKYDNKTRRHTNFVEMKVLQQMNKSSE